LALERQLLLLKEGSTFKHEKGGQSKINFQVCPLILKRKRTLMLLLQHFRQNEDKIVGASDSSKKFASKFHDRDRGAQSRDDIRNHKRRMPNERHQVALEMAR
jgi:hypothetical protein